MMNVKHTLLNNLIKKIVIPTSNHNEYYIILIIKNEV